MSTVHIGIGSNLGDKLAHIENAILLLKPDVLPIKVSSIYQTKPWGYSDQPDFYNCAVAATTRLTPHQLLKKLKTIETRMGRIPTIRNGPRVIDLDILIYEDRIVQTKELEIPHPKMNARAFVLVPLAEIAPELRHPQNGLAIKELLETLDLSGVQKTAHSLQGIIK